MSILNVDKIQPIGGGSTITVDATDIQASTGTIRASTFSGDVSATGIGVTSLSVAGVATVTGNIDVVTSSTNVGVAVTQNGTGNILNLYDGSNLRFAVNQYGNPTVTSGNPVYASTNSSSSVTTTLFSNSAGQGVLQTNSGHSLILGTGGVEKVRITSNGHVNIGGDYAQTTYKLRVSGTSYLGGVVRVPNGSAAAPAIHFGDSDSGVYGDASNGVRLTAGGSDTIVATSNGVTFPPKATALTSFTLGSQSALSKPLYFADAASVESASILLDNSSQELRIKNGRFSGQITFTTYNTEKVRIDSSGRVMIGTTSANANNKIHARLADGSIASNSTASVILAENSGNSWITIGSGASSYGGILFADSGAADIGQVRYNHSTNALEFLTNGGNSSNIRMKIDSSGRIGLGIDNPTEKLHVSGSSTPTILNKPTDASPALFVGDSNRTGAGQHLAEYRGNWNGTTVARMVIHAGDDTTNKDDGEITFRTATAGSTTEALRIKSRGYREIRNYHLGPWAFTNNTTKTTITVGDPGDNKFTTIKLILTLIDGNYRQNLWQGEYTIFVTNAAGGPGVNYYLKEHWQHVGSGNWSGGTVSVAITSSGALQFTADNGHNDANGNAYVHILDVIGHINGSDVATISA